MCPTMFSHKDINNIRKSLAIYITYLIVMLTSCLYSFRLNICRERKRRRKGGKGGRGGKERRKERKRKEGQKKHISLKKKKEL